jgi:hypothetical protein
MSSGTRNVYICQYTTYKTYEDKAALLGWQNLLSILGTGTMNSQCSTSSCLSSVTSLWAWFELTTLVVTSTDCVGSCKSNYHSITTTTAHGLTRHSELSGIKLVSTLGYNPSLRKEWVQPIYSKQDSFHMKENMLHIIISSANENMYRHSWNHQCPLLLVPIKHLPLDPPETNKGYEI